MAPLARPALLAVLLLTPAVLRAQTEADARAGMAALKEKYSAAGAQKPAETAPTVDPGKLASSKAVIANAKISPEKLGWTDQNLADLGPAITAASRAVDKLHEDNPSEVSKMPYGGGSAVNLEDSIKWATGAWGGSELKRGCVSHQGVTFSAVASAIKNGSLEVRGVFVHRGVFGHHAVIVFPKGSDWKKGVVLDGWIHQESAPDRITFLFKDWNGLTSWGAALE